MPTDLATPPNFARFHLSLTEELYSTKDRIRSLVNHWPTDGESKEVALRSVLRRHLPKSLEVCRGFVVTKDESSSQIDVLIVDSTKPILFREGDLVIVTPDAVRAVIEVKTSLRTKREVRDAVAKLSKIDSLCRDATGHDSVWTGLFIFDDANPKQPYILQGIGEAYKATERPIHSVSCGKNVFIRYWPRGVDACSPEPGSVWHSYEVCGVAPSYFMGNLIDWVSSVDNSSSGYAWFPMIGGKEFHRKYFLRQGETKPRSFV